MSVKIQQQIRGEKRRKVETTLFRNNYDLNLKNKKSIERADSYRRHSMLQSLPLRRR